MNHHHRRLLLLSLLRLPLLQLSPACHWNVAVELELAVQVGSGGVNRLGVVLLKSITPRLVVLLIITLHTGGIIPGVLILPVFRNGKGTHLQFIEM
jgi:hypothetical protein